MNLREITVSLQPFDAERPLDAWPELSVRRALVFSEFLYYELRGNRRPCPWPKILVWADERPATVPEVSLAKVGDLAEVYQQLPYDAFDVSDEEAMELFRRVVLTALDRIRSSEVGWHDPEVERLVREARLDAFRFSVAYPRLSRVIRRGGARVSTSLDVSLSGSRVLVVVSDAEGQCVLEQVVASNALPLTLREFFDARSAEIAEGLFRLKDADGNVLATVALPAALDTQDASS